MYITVEIAEMRVSLVEPVKRQSWLSVVNYLRIEGKRIVYTKYSITWIRMK